MRARSTFPSSSAKFLIFASGVICFGSGAAQASVTLSPRNSIAITQAIHPVASANSVGRVSIPLSTSVSSNPLTGTSATFNAIAGHVGHSTIFAGNPNSGGQLPGCGPSGNTPSKCEVASAVPEASTWAMMLLGFLGIGAAMGRSRKSARFMQIA